MIIVTSQEHLTEILQDGKLHKFRLILNGGAYTRKGLKLCNNGRTKFIRFIDYAVLPPCSCYCTWKDLADKEFSNIPLGIEKHAFIMES